jgi:M6 family metalloprotease-like protein
VHSRFAIVGTALTALLAVAHLAHASGTYEVRRALTPDEAAAMRARGTPWTGAVLNPEQARAHAAREDRMRRMPHRLAPDGFDWGAAIRSRVGPRHLTRNPHQRVPAGAKPAGATAITAEGDTLRIALIRIDFATDRLDTQTTGNGRFDLSPVDTLVPPIDRPPRNRDFYQAHLEAQRRYYVAQSYGSVQVVGDVWPRDTNGAYRVSDMADFGPWRFSQDIYGQAVHMMRTMFFAADSQSTASGDRIPWDDYDGFMLVHAGSDFQSDLRGDSEYDIPSFTLGVEDTSVIIFPDSTYRPIGSAMIVPETVNQDGFFAALNGVFAHEQGHNLWGFADLYDINTGYPTVGYWSLMDSGNLVGSLVQTPLGETIYAVGLLPPSVDPFQRFFIGDQLNFVDVSYGDTMRIANSERNPDMRRLWMSSDEYLLLENRAIAAGDTLRLDQDSTTRVVLGPESPDQYEYDALLPGPGLLIWHIDASVIPFSTALRQNNDYGWNTNPARLGVSVVEADKLGDLGDPGSPFLLGSYYDPWFVGNQTSLSDTTIPPLQPHIRTRTHTRLDVHDVPLPVMRVRVVHTWQLPNWPVAVDLAPEGIEPLMQDADGDGVPEVCWAGGGEETSDSAAVFAVKANGQGLFDPAVYAIASLPARPLQPLAARGLGPVPSGSVFNSGPAHFAVTTRITGDPGNPGGQVFLLDNTGSALPGWPANLPAAVTTPPVLPRLSDRVLVGAADGRVYALDLSGNVVWSSPTALNGPIAGRLATWSPSDPFGNYLIAAGSASGEIGVWKDWNVESWSESVFGSGFKPDFLWLSFDGNGAPASSGAACGINAPTLVVHHADRLWAFCASDDPVFGFQVLPLPGWGRSFPDSFVTGLGAADIDRDGYLEVLAQTRHSGVVYFNQSGAPSPGWPKPTTREAIPAGSPVLALDVDGDQKPEMVSFDGSGKLNAIRPDNSQPDGWPLSLGAGALGAPLGGDLNGDGILDVIAPDRALNDSLQFLINGRFENLYAYTIPAGDENPLSSPWTMVGGDPGRTSSLPLSRTPTAGANAAGGPLVAHTLKAYPNPAIRKPVAFAFQLTEPAQVEVDILDTSGHRVAGFTVDGMRSDNVAVWDPGKVPAGLYLARLRFRGPSGDHSEIVQVGVLR